MRWPKYTAGGFVFAQERHEQRKRERAWQAAERNAGFPGRRSLPIVELVRSMIAEARRRRNPPPRVMGGRYRPLSDNEKRNPSTWH